MFHWNGEFFKTYISTNICAKKLLNETGKQIMQITCIMKLIFLIKMDIWECKLFYDIVFILQSISIII